MTNLYPLREEEFVSAPTASQSSGGAAAANPQPQPDFTAQEEQGFVSAPAARVYDEVTGEWVTPEELARRQAARRATAEALQQNAPEVLDQIQGAIQGAGEMVGEAVEANQEPFFLGEPALPQDEAAAFASTTRQPQAPTDFVPDVALDPTQLADRRGENMADVFQQAIQDFVPFTDEGAAQPLSDVPSEGAGLFPTRRDEFIDTRQGGRDGMMLVNGQWVPNPETQEAERGGGINIDLSGLGPDIVTRLITPIEELEAVSDFVAGVARETNFLESTPGIGSTIGLVRRGLEAANVDFNPSEEAARALVPTTPAELLLIGVPALRAAAKGGAAAGLKSLALNVANLPDDLGERIVASGVVPEGAVRRTVADPAVVEPGRLVSPTEGEGLAAIRGGAPTQAQEEVRHVGALDAWDTVESNVDTSDNAVVRLLAGHSSINPSVLNNTDIGRKVTTFLRQRIAADTLADVAVSSALDTHAQRFTGRLGGLLPMDRDGLMTVTRKGGVRGKAVWTDVFDNPSKFDLSDAQLSYIADFHKVLDEMNAYRAANGLDTLAIRTPEGFLSVPRQVAKVRDVELRKPSNASLRRIHEEAVEGFANGVRYDRDPRQTLLLYVRSSYREVVEKQLADALEPHLIKPSALVPEPVRIRLEQAIKARKAAQREVAADIAKLQKNLQRPANTARQIQLRKRDLKALEDYKASKASAKLEAAKSQYAAAKNAYSKEMQAAKKAQFAPGNIFGKTEADIPVRIWRNSFLPEEDYKVLADGIGRFVTKGEVVEANWAAKAIGTALNVRRMIVAGLDPAAPFIHGLPVFGQNPLRWAQATFNSMQAMFDPTVQARFMREHIRTFQEMAAAGVPVGDTEFFAAAVRGEGIGLGRRSARIVENAPGGYTARQIARGIGNQSFGRFQSNYNTFLSMSRAYLWEGSKMAPPQKAQWIRNMTGGLNPQALGVGPNQRNLEGLWLAFSPRLLRSTMGLGWDAMHFWTDEGRAAFRTLGQTAMAATMIYSLTGMALGKSEEEIRAGLNPLNGKKFLSHEINGDWVGVGGQIRAITQLMAAGGASVKEGNPDAFLSSDRFDNPLMNFYFNRGAPAVEPTLAVLEAASGGDWNIHPYTKIDGIPDLASHLGTGTLPFTVQAILEHQNAASALSGFFGARTSPQTPSERRTSLIEDEILPRYIDQGVLPESLRGKGIDELGSGEMDLIEATIREQAPDVQAAWEKRRRELESPFQAANDRYAEIDDEEGGYSDQLDALMQGLMKGNDPRAVFNEVDNLMNRREGERANVRRDSDYKAAIAELDGNDIRLIEDLWFSIPENAKKDGLIDWDVVEERRNQFLDTLAADNPEMAQRFANNLLLRDQRADVHPILKLRDEIRDEAAAYFDMESPAEKEAYLRENPDVNANLWLIQGNALHSVAALEQAVNSGVTRDDIHLSGASTPATAENLPIFKRYEGQIDQLLTAGTERTNLRKGDILLDALYYWLGYGEGVVYHDPDEILRIVEEWGGRADGTPPRAPAR